MHYSDKDTLPDDVLVPQFSGNADFVDVDNLFAARESRRDMWIGVFPRLDRPPDELVIYFNINNFDFLHRKCLFTREYIRKVLKNAEV